MIPLNYPSNVLSANILRPGTLLRELTPRQDRIPPDQRVDLPEIQESFRVSFSEEARANASSAPGDEPYRPPPAGVAPETARQLRTYEAIARL